MPQKRARVTAVVMAAGQGTRMRSRTVKLLHPVAGVPMVHHVFDVLQAVQPSRSIAVIGYQADLMRRALEGRCDHFVLQKQQRGTGHAVMQAVPHIPRTPGSIVLILNGDVPSLRPATLRSLLAKHRRSGASLTLLTAEVDPPDGYGRILRDPRGRVLRIVEQKDADREQRRIREINSGFYCFDGPTLLSGLKSLRPNNVQREYYLTDLVGYVLKQGGTVAAQQHGDAQELLGVNTRAELAEASRTLYARTAAELQTRGVSILDPTRTWIDGRARIGRDTTIYPDVIVEGPTTIGEDCVIRSGSRISDCKIGKQVQIKDHCVLEGSRVGNGAQLGPFAHVRPETILEADTKVGNFVELKKTKLGRGSKASHLSYLGDAQIGPDCNIGAGTITCNYDGRNKHLTRLGRGVFIGSDSQLVAPVEVKAGAYVAAGTTVTQQVPSGALAVGRARQRNVKGWVARRNKKKKD